MEQVQLSDLLGQQEVVVLLHPGLCPPQKRVHLCMWLVLCFPAVGGPEPLVLPCGLHPQSCLWSGLWPVQRTVLKPGLWPCQEKLGSVSLLFWLGLRLDQKLGLLFADPLGILLHVLQLQVFP